MTNDRNCRGRRAVMASAVSAIIFAVHADSLPGVIAAIALRNKL